MGSSICANCTIKSEDSDIQALPQVQQIVFEYTDYYEIPETSKSKEQPLQQQTDILKNVQSPKLRGILKHNFQQNKDLGNFSQDNKSPTITIQRKKVKFRKPSKLNYSD
ncbi:unnamed protein product [Paramecium primaurelia]|uniref:Uncharacterized protein n=1 Tax=Paramecium primaurelia TaxID=5886 RepID=A0A8S1KXE1_PARPR|nr:unnamed protein product [Paramecium primaurelia]